MNLAPAKIAWLFIGIVVPFIALGRCAEISKAQVLEAQARQIAKNVGIQSRERGSERFLRIYRMESLEDIFYSLRPSRPSPNLRDPYFFEVSNEGLEFAENSYVSHFSVHGPSTSILAISASSGEEFRVSGFRDSHDEFNRLLNAYGVSISRDSQANDLFDLYLQLNPKVGRTFLGSFLQAKQEAEKAFVESHKNFAEAQRLFEKWWAGQRDFLSRIDFQKATLEKDGGFVLSFYSFSGSRKGGRFEGLELLKVSIELTVQGRLEKPQFDHVSK
jgi:hypothetical protein